MFKQTISLTIAAFSAISLFGAGKTAASESDTLKSRLMPTVTVIGGRAKPNSPAPYSEINSVDIGKIYNFQDAPALFSETPNALSYSQNGNGVGYTSLKIRGFDQRRIAVLVNGVPQNDPEDHDVYWIDMPDLLASSGSVQTQRGSGLAQYGSPSIAASINIATKNYAQSSFMKVTAGMDLQKYNDDYYRNSVNKLGLEYSSGLVGDYAFYGKISKITSAGYRENSWANLTSYFLSAIKFDNNLTTQINVFGGPLSDGSCYNGIPKAYISDYALRRQNLSYFGYDSTGKNIAYTGARRKQEQEYGEQPHVEILNDYKINDNLSIKSTLFYYYYDGYFDYDASWADYGDASSPINSILRENGYTNALVNNSIFRGYVANKQGGFLPRLVYTTEGNEFTFGLEARLHKSYHWGAIQTAENLPSGYDPDFKIYKYNGSRRILSAYASDAYNITEKLQVKADLQLVNHYFGISNEYSGNNAVRYYNADGTLTDGKLFGINYLFLNPRLAFNYNFDEKSNAFLSFANTKREPRMRNLYAAEDHYTGATPNFEITDTTGGVIKYDFTKPIIKPESLFDIELGAKYRSETYSLSANIYFMNYSNEFVKSGKLDVFGSPIDANASKTRHIGIEIDAATRLYKGALGEVNLKANCGYSSNTFVNYTYYVDGYVIDLKDNKIAGFPDFLGNVRINYNKGGFDASFLGKYVGKFYSDNYGEYLQSDKGLINALASNGEYYYDNVVDAYVVCDLDFSYKFANCLSMKDLTIKASIRNLFDNNYAASAEGQEYYPGAERSIYLGIELGL